MPATTGLSHAAAAFVSLLLSATIGTYIEEYELVETATDAVGTTLANATGGTISPEFSGPIVVVTGLSFLWGVAYHWRRFGGTADGMTDS